MGLLGSRWAIILPLIALLMPLGVFWMRTHFLNTETALTEAAQTDGANTWRIFRQIHLPLAVPAWSALAISSSSRPGTSTSCHSSSSTTRQNEQSPAVWAHFKVNTAPTSCCCARARCLSSHPRF